MERLSGWKIFSLRGVDVRLHVSLLFLLLYVMIVGTASFPLIVKESGVNPVDMTGSPPLWTFAFAIALVISIFLHEFSHVLVAQSKGVKVRQITLMLLGGAAQMEEIPEEPMSEFKVAIIGPLVSLAIAGVLYWVRSITTSADIAFFSYWVGHTNLVLAIFNLLPAFPTDGGRVLRAFLAARFGRLRGTQIAVRISNGFAWVFGIIGFVYFNFLLMLIAFFIYGAAKSELLMLWGQTILTGLKAGDILTKVSVLPADSSLAQAVAEMTNTRQLFLPVVGSEKNIYYITAEMIGKIPRSYWNQTTTKQIAIPVPNAVDVNDDLEKVWPVLLSFPDRAMPAKDGQNIVGIVSKAALMETFELRRLNSEGRSSYVPTWSPQSSFS